jgi:peptidoglycan/LPS O-acetylase OafA/YrhL
MRNGHRPAFGTARSQPNGRYNNVDAVRLFLALNVAVGHGCHCWFGFDYRYGLAVSMFLGISGYLVLESRENSISVGHFLWKRFLRIYPLMAATIVIGVIWLRRPLLQVLLYLFTAGLRGDSMLGPGWTIVVEEVMYLFLVVLFAIGAYRRSLWIMALLLLSVVTLQAVYFRVPTDIQRIMILPANFFFGNLLFMHRHTLAPYYKWVTLPCAIFGYGYMLTSFPVPWPAHAVMAFSVLAQFMGIIACIGFGLHAPAIFGWLRTTVGDLSYSVYLIHSLLLGWFLPHPLSSNARTFAAFLGSSLLFGSLSWRFIEHPALRFRDLPKARVSPRRRPDAFTVAPS